MAQYDGAVRINTQLNTKPFDSGIKNMVSGLKGIAAAAGVAFSIAKIVQFGKSAIDVASDLAEVDNVVNKSFGDMRGEMDALADSAIKSLGMSRLTAYQTGSTFMAMGASMVDSAEDAKTMSLELTKLTGNMASFYNVSQDVASTALKSIYTGETESLKKFGVVMSEVNLKQFAQAQGIKKAYTEMTQSEKVMLRYKYVTEQLGFIGDDFLDTQDGWANQTRILAEQWKEFSGIVGNSLITVFTPIIKVLNNAVSSLISMAQAVDNVIQSLWGTNNTQDNSVQKTTEGIVDGYEDAADAVADYEKATKSATGATDELNIVSQNNGSTETADFDIDTIKAAADASKEIEEVKTPAWLTTMIESFKKLQGIIEPIKKSIESMFSVGESLATNLMQSITNTIDNDGGALGEHLAAAFNNFEAMANTAAGVWDTIAVSFEAFKGEKAVSITTTLLSTFMEAFGSLVQLTSENMKAIFDIMVAPFVNNKDRFKQAVENAFSAIQPIILTISDFISTAVEKITELYKEHIKPFQEKIAQWLSDLSGKLLDFFNTYVIPYYELVANGINELYESYIKPIFSGIIDTIGGLIDIIEILWEELIVPAIDDIVENVLPKLMPVIEAIWLYIKGVLGEIGSLLLGLVNTVKNVVLMIKALLQDDWAAAWGYAKQAVIAPINGILGAVESMVNGVINGLNKMVDAMNNLSFEVPDWVPGLGGKSFGFNIPRISNISLPRVKLANGGITTGSTVANIGEAGREAVLPLENNMQYLDPLADRLSEKIGSTIAPYLQTLVGNTNTIASKDYSVNIGDREIARANMRGVQSMGMQLIR